MIRQSTACLCIGAIRQAALPPIKRFFSALFRIIDFSNRTGLYKHWAGLIQVFLELQRNIGVSLWICKRYMGHLLQERRQRAPGGFPIYFHGLFYAEEETYGPEGFRSLHQRVGVAAPSVTEVFMDSPVKEIPPDIGGTECSSPVASGEIVNRREEPQVERYF